MTNGQSPASSASMTGIKTVSKRLNWNWQMPHYSISQLLNDAGIISSRPTSSINSSYLLQEEGEKSELKGSSKTCGYFVYDLTILSSPTFTAIFFIFKKLFIYQRHTKNYQ